jgi:hypothetical protein
MDTRIKKTLYLLEIELQSTETLLREHRRCHQTSQLMCVLCGRTLPEVAKKCHLCRNSILVPRHCTSETRIAEYFAVLRKAELWPTAKLFREWPISDIASRFISAKADLKHSCTGGSSCPLLTSMESLIARVDGVQKSITGLCLACVRQPEWEDGLICSHK